MAGLRVCLSVVDDVHIAADNKVDGGVFQFANRQVQAVPVITAVRLFLFPLVLSRLAGAYGMPYKRKLTRTNDSRRIHYVHMALRENQHFGQRASAGIGAVVIVNTRLIVQFVIPCPLVRYVRIIRGHIRDRVCRNDVERKDDCTVAAVHMVGVAIDAGLIKRAVAESITAACTYLRTDARLTLRENGQIQYMLCNHIAGCIFVHLFVLACYCAYYAAPTEDLALTDSDVLFVTKYLLIGVDGINTVAACDGRVVRIVCTYTRDFDSAVILREGGECHAFGDGIGRVNRQLQYV